MPQDYFLDYLCGIGLASKKKITTIGSKPSYPNQNARVPRGTRFYSDITQYTIEMGIAKCENDKTKVVIPLLKLSPQQLKDSPLQKRSSTITLLEKILEYLKSFETQQGGIPFTGQQGGIGPGYHAQHPDNPVDADYLLALGGAFLPGPGQSGLDMTLAIKNLSDLIVELKQNEAEYEAKEKEILSKANTDPLWKDKYAKNTEEAEAKEKEIIENKKDNILKTEKKYIYNGEKIEITISSGEYSVINSISPETIWNREFAGVKYGYHENRNDTVLTNKADSVVNVREKEGYTNITIKRLGETRFTRYK
jgi:hypothetical protein